MCFLRYSQNRFFFFCDEESDVRSEKNKILGSKRKVGSKIIKDKAQ